MARRVSSFSDSYVERLFQVWYENSGPTPKNFYEIISEKGIKDEDNKIPSVATLDAWLDEKDWLARKDLLDARVATQIDDELVALKVNMLREQAAQFRAVRNKAAKHLLENDFDTSSAAVAALVKSAQEERIAHGLSRTIQRLASLDDEALVNEVKQLAAKVGAVIDAGEMPEEEEENTEE